MAIRLVATDLDGTLVRSDGTVSGRTRAAIAAAEDAGIHVVMVTARPLRWLEDLWELVGDHGLAVVSNGAIVVDVPSRTVREARGIDRDTGLALCAAIREAVPSAGFGIETVAGLRRESGLRDAPGDLPPLAIGRIEDLWPGPEEPVVKLLVVDLELSAEEFRGRVERAVGSRAIATWSVPHLMEISAVGVTKGDTLALLADELDVSVEEVAAVGDMPNDLPMIEWAGLGCAVGNAHPSVLTAADRVLPANDEDGVAVLLEELLAQS